jgi:lysophospholipase L1-like esterase
MTPAEFISKYQGVFADNEFQRITEETYRDFSVDIANTFSAASGAPGDETGRLRLFTGTADTPQACVRDCFYLVDGRRIVRAKQDFNGSVAPQGNTAYWQVVLEVPAAVLVLDAPGTSTVATMSQRIISTMIAAVAYEPISAGQFGPHPDLPTRRSFEQYVLAQQRPVLTAPVAPTNVQVDDAHDLMSVQVVPGYDAYAQYQAFYPGSKGRVPLNSDIAYQVDNRIFLKFAGAAAVGEVGIGVAGSGNRPEGAFATNDKVFTGTVVATPAGDTVAPNIELTVPAAGATLTLNTQVPLTVVATDNVSVTSVTFTNGATGEVLGQGAKNGNTYTLPYTPTTAGPFTLKATASDAAGNTQSATVNVTVQAATTTPVATKANAPRFGVINDVDNVVSLNSDYAYDQTRWGVEGQGAQTLGSNSICSPGNISGRLYAYVIADAATNRLQSDTVYSEPFSVAANPNTKPTATISIVGGVSSYNVGQVATLQLDGFDSDTADSVVKLELLDNGVKISGAEISGSSGMIQTPALTVGTHNYTARATDSKGATGISLAVVVTASAPASQVGVSVAPVSSNFSQNSLDESYSGYTRRSPMATLTTEVEGTTTLVVKQFGNSIGSNGGTTVYIDGNYAAHLSNAAAGVQDFPITLPSVAKHVVKYVEGGQSRPYESGDVQVESSIQLITPGAGGTITIVAPTKTADSYYVIPDSIGNGAGGSMTSRTGWVPQFRVLTGQDVIIDGYGFSGYKRFEQQAQRDALLQRCILTWQGRGGQKNVMIDLGTNDYNIGGGYQSAEATAAIEAALLETFHNYDASIKLFVKSPITRLDTGANSNFNQPLSTYSSAILGQASTHQYATFVDGSEWVLLSDISQQDRVHPIDSGQTKIANRWYGVVTGQAGTTPTVPPVTAYAPAGLWEQDSQYVTIIGSDFSKNTENLYSAGSGITFATGTKFRIAFHGIQLKFYTPLYTGLGRARITIDGVLDGTFSQATNGIANSAERYATNIYPDGDHIAIFDFDPANIGTGVLYYDAVLVIGASSTPTQPTNGVVFSDAYDASSWLTFGPATQSVSGGNLSITPTGGQSGIILSGRATSGTFSIQGRRFVVPIQQLLTADTANDMSIAIQSNTAYSDGYSQIRMVVENGRFAFEDANGIIESQVGYYNMTDMRFISIREKDGSYYGETSPDGNTWTLLSKTTGSGALAFNPLAVHLVVYAGTVATPTTGSPGTGIFGPAYLLTV